MAYQNHLLRRRRSWVRRSALCRGYSHTADPRPLRAITRQYNLEREPLSTGRQLPRVSLRAQSAFALSPWYLRRLVPGVIASSVLIAVLAAWGIASFLGG